MYGKFGYVNYYYYICIIFKIKSMCVFCDYDAKKVGEFFGYPKCCTDWYIEHAEKYGRGDTLHLTYHQQKFHKDTEGIGFMPCPKHAKQINKKGITPDEVLSNRVCSVPFPYVDEYSEEEFKKWIKNNLK